MGITVECKNNCAFITTMGIDVNTFKKNPSILLLSCSWTLPFAQNFEKTLKSVNCLAINKANYSAFCQVNQEQISFFNKFFWVCRWIEPSSASIWQWWVHLFSPLIDFLILTDLFSCIWSWCTVKNAYYNGWTCAHYCSCILAVAPDSSIIYSIFNAPGL